MRADLLDDQQKAIAPTGCIHLWEQTHTIQNFIMGQPLGYFTGYTPGDGGLLSDLSDSWGSYFGELTKSEKLWMLSSVTGMICADKSEHYNPHDVSDDIIPACERLGELEFGDQLGLAQFLIANL